MEELQQFCLFKENTTRIIKITSAHFLRFKSKELKKKHPNLYKDLEYWYKRIFGIKPILNGCSMTFIEKFSELRILTEIEITNRMELKSRLKSGKVFSINNIYYCDKSKHLTNAVCEQIYNIYGKDAFETYVKVEDFEDAVIVDDTMKKLTIEDMFKNETEQPKFDDMTVKELKAYAKENNIELVNRRRADIIEELKAI